MNRVLVFALMVMVTINSCKKDKDITGTVSNGRPTIPGGAAGAFYAVRNNSKVAGGITSATYGAIAWFGSYSNTQYVNSLTVNGVTMVDSAAGLPTGLYGIGANGGNVDLSATDVNWVTTGNTSLDIPAFSYNDTSSFPAIAWFSLPSTVSLSSTLTVNFTYTVPGSQLFVELSDGSTSTTYTKSYPANSTSISFNPSEIEGIGAISGDEIAIQIIAVGMSGQSFGGKEYYFVKENAFAEYTSLY